MLVCAWGLDWEDWAGGLCFPTGGWSLLSMTVYFWSVLAEKERVVPTLT